VTGPGRRAISLSLVALAIVVGGVGPAGCQTDSHPASCDFQEQVALVGTPLTLLSGARLDRVGSGFLLLGYDGHLVRWAPVTSGGQPGAEQSLPLPASATAGPWFAAAGKVTAGDTVLIAYGVPSATAGMVDVQILAAAAGSGAAAPAGTLVTIPDPTAASGAQVVMGSGRMGMRAALAWTVAGGTDVRVQAMTGDGRAQGAPVVERAAGASPLIDCLSFVAGKDDLAVGFIDAQAANDNNPGWTILELRDDGALDSSLTFTLGTVSPTCPFSAATDTGYVTVWQNELGSFIDVYDGKTQVFTPKLFAGAVTFGGADQQPPLTGVGPVAGGDFAVVLARPGAAEAWRLTAAGAVTEGSVVLPSSVGQMGKISSVSVSGALYVTYADYASSASAGTDGQRFFVKIACF
jgi:hypothetical protein